MLALTLGSIGDNEHAAIDGTMARMRGILHPIHTVGSS